MVGRKTHIKRTSSRDWYENDVSTILYGVDVCSLSTMNVVVVVSSTER
jgi:hypothetical protein